MAPPRYSKETIKYRNERILAQISNQRGTRRRNAEKKENAIFYFFVAVADSSPYNCIYCLKTPSGITQRPQRGWARKGRLKPSGITQVRSSRVVAVFC